MKAILLFSLLLSLNLSAKVVFNISVIYRKGLDQDLTLQNEFHRSYKKNIGDYMYVEMKNGLRILFKSEGIIDGSEVGPTKKVRLMGKVMNSEEKIITEFKNQDIVLNFLEEKRKIVKTDQGQEIEFIFNVYPAI